MTTEKCDVFVAADGTKFFTKEDMEAYCFYNPSTDIAEYENKIKKLELEKDGIIGEIRNYKHCLKQVRREYNDAIVQYKKWLNETDRKTRLRNVAEYACKAVNAEWQIDDYLAMIKEAEKKLDDANKFLTYCKEQLEETKNAAKIHSSNETFDSEYVDYVLKKITEGNRFSINDGTTGYYLGNKPDIIKMLKQLSGMLKEKEEQEKHNRDVEK